MNPNNRDCTRDSTIAVAVNGIEWTVNPRRKELPCIVCSRPTKGRIDGEAMCTDDGIRALMEPIAEFRNQLRAVLGSRT